MIQTKKDLNFYIKADRIMNGYPTSKSPLLFLKNLVDKPAACVIMSYLNSMRHYAYYRNTIKSKFSLKILPMLLWHRKWNRLGLKLGFSIGPNSLGYGVVIPHNGTIVVNSDARIGNFAVLHTCTCVAGGDKRIGDFFYLSTGSQIVGKIDLGDSVTVAAHSLVNSSFDYNCLLAGAPAELKKDNYNSWIERDGAHWKERYNRVVSLRKRIYNN